ncbi:MAG: AtpZ/AtpI family protein [Bacteroidota bacterium]
MINKSLLKYTGIASQMAISIGLGVYGGIKLDEVFQTEKPYLTLVFSLTGVVLGMYIAMKDFIRKK